LIKIGWIKFWSLNNYKLRKLENSLLNIRLPGVCFVLPPDGFFSIASCSFHKDCGNFKKVLFVNLKTYQQGTGVDAINLVRILESVAHEAQVKIIPVVQASDVREISSFSKLEIWVQHVDWVEYGAHTGFILPEAVFEDGAIGTFLNHSEHKFKDFKELEKAHQRATNVGLKTLVFAADLEELRKLIYLKPTYIAYEPPDLIGSKTISVAQAKLEIINKVVKITNLHDVPFIVGAGIRSAQDVRKSLGSGAVGVAVSSDVVTAKDPRKEILDLVEGFR